MQRIEFIKMHGLGNDFVIIDCRFNNIEITKDIIRKLSDRKTGAGCDQVLTIENKISDNHDACIKIFNQNGDSAEACGNGTRCVAKLLFDENNSSSIKLLSLVGTLIAKKFNDNLISVNLGKISHYWKDIPMANKLDTLNIPIKLENFSSGVGINIGNPHVVFFGEDIDEFDLEKFGPQIENNSLFPKKTNVEIVEIINRKTIRMKVWERGAGITLACGTGACASVYAGMLKNLIDNEVEVQLTKGSLYIKIQNKEAILTGPATISYRGHIEL